MDIKRFIQNKKVSTLHGNAFKFLLDLYSKTDKDGIVHNFTIMGYVQEASKENGQITGRNTLARFIDDFEERGILEHDRYGKTIKFKEIKN